VLVVWVGHDGGVVTCPRNRIEGNDVDAIVDVIRRDGSVFFFKTHRHINGVATNAETFGHMAPLGEAGFLIINI
jgi:hypothetical protein